MTTSQLSYKLFYPQARLARSEVSVPSVTEWQRWNSNTIRPCNSRVCNNTRKKTKSANNEWEGFDQKPHSQTLTLKEPNVKNSEPVQTSLETRSNVSTFTKAAVWNHVKFLAIFSELFKKHLGELSPTSEVVNRVLLFSYKRSALIWEYRNED